MDIANSCNWGTLKNKMGPNKEHNMDPYCCLFDVSSDTCTLQALIDMWHDGLGVCRATQQVGQAIALTIRRYLPETGMKHQQKIDFSSTVRFSEFRQC